LTATGIPVRQTTNSIDPFMQPASSFEGLSQSTGPDMQKAQHFHAGLFGLD
jgi:hypothetical protein